MIGTARDLISGHKAPYLAIDTESNGKDNRHDPDSKTIGMSMHGPGFSPVYYPLKHQSNNVSTDLLPAMKDLIENHPLIVFHNAKHDMQALRDWGIEVKDRNYFDTMLMVHWTNEELPSKSLDYCSTHYGGQPKKRPKLMSTVIKRYGWGMIPVELMAPYASNDAYITGELFRRVYPKFKEEGFTEGLWQREREFIDLINRMELLGIEIDTDLCEAEVMIGKGRMNEIVGKLGGLNPSSNPDMEELLLNQLGLPIHHYTDNGNPSFDKDAMDYYETILENRSDPTAQLVFEYRGWQKTVGSNYQAYLDLLAKDGALHPNYKFHGARTSRLSCEKPNLQQIPRGSKKRWNGNLKRAFVPRIGYRLWEADYSNLEMRIAGSISADQKLLGTFNSGRNLFDDMRDQLQRDRDQCKTLTYALLFGAGVDRIKDIFDIPFDEAKGMKAEFYGNYHGVGSKNREIGNIARRRGYVRLWTGRRRHFGPDAATHKAFNSVIQGGGAEIVKSSMLILDKLIDWDECKMLLTVHDSVVFEIKQGKEEYWHKIIRDTMQAVGNLHPGFNRCPFPVDVCEWGTKKGCSCAGCESTKLFV